VDGSATGASTPNKAWLSSFGPAENAGRNGHDGLFLFLGVLEWWNHLYNIADVVNKFIYRKEVVK